MGDLMQANAFYIEQQEQQIVVFRAGFSEPIVTQHAIADHRPFLHPIAAPDGIGELTEYSPGHHPHQTGLYWGFTRVNGTGADPELLKEWFYKKDQSAQIQKQIGRDFFHNPGVQHWQRISAEVLEAAGAEVRWQTVYAMLDAEGSKILSEIQRWSLCETDGQLVLDLAWKGTAHGDFKVGQFPYGGLFLRMPFRKESGGRALNSEGADQGGAEGQRARWVGVEMPIPGREQVAEKLCSVAIMDHPSNPDHPTPWRADGQLGIGPSRGIAGDWEIADGESAVFRHRFLLACGGLDRAAIEREWERFVKA
jgi:hypothetical protein